MSIAGMFYSEYCALQVRTKSVNELPLKQLCVLCVIAPLRYKNMSRYDETFTGIKKAA
jgi:hypothetical protein